MSDSQALTFSPGSFDITKAELEQMVAPFKGLQVLDPTDLVWINKMQDAISNLVKMRTTITTTWKKWREVSNAYNKAVIAYEKTLLEYVVPLEQEYKDTLSDIAKQEAMDRMRAKLPDRKRAIIDKNVPELSDEQILSMSDEQFGAYLNPPPPPIPVMQEIKKIDKRMEYSQWLDSIKYSPDTMRLEERGGVVTAYRIYSTFKL